MDYQKVHPATIDRPAAPVAPDRLSNQSKKSDELDRLPLFIPSVSTPPPNINTNRRRKRSGLCRCLCWTMITIITLIIAIAITIGILYLVFRPKIPHYSIDGLTVKSFSINNNNTASASFNIAVTARNPNKRIGIYYIDGSKISAWYNTTMLCNGTFPVFYQGHHNTTMVNVTLSGVTVLTNELTSEIQNLEQSGSIPLKVKGDVPVKVKFGAVKLFKVTGRVRCSLDLVSLSSNQELKFNSSSCSFKLKL
ncbi:hypothetical protein LUZ60_012061 [Juncus effusus]|nr:hypothetical protein LUZ60_012061 [Juncus effusus]